MSDLAADHGDILRPNRKRGAALFLIAITLVALAAASYVALTSQLLRAASEQTPQRATFYADAIDDALTRLEHLPFVLSTNPDIRAALASGEADTLNPLLADYAQSAEAEFVYLLNRNGLTIASSNYQDANSLVGNHYTFRPYFRDAVAGGEGRYFAVGVTTGRPGYFLAEPVRSLSGEVLGVVTVKIGFGDLSRVLTDSGELLLLSNAQGVVLASSDEALTYGQIASMTPDDLLALRQQQQFGEQVLFPLDWTEKTERRITLDGTSYVWTPVSLAEENWTLHLLSDVADIRRQAFLYVAVGIITLLALLVAAAIFRAVQLRRALTISNADRKRLALEIEDRKRAEQKLEVARTALARKNQLAALGQMAASITHELGQPISAMRNYLAAEEITRDAAPDSVLPELSGIVSRMQGILNQLRQFGQHNPNADISFSLQDTIRAAQQLVAHTAQAADVDIDVQMPDHTVKLKGNPQQVEQVVVNLLRNAIDATHETDVRNVTLTVQDTDTQVIVTVADSGCGLGDYTVADLREPFFSTKASGQGMGLGLAISGQIVNEMGGTLQARNAPEGGAIFTVTLPKDQAIDA